MNQKNEFDAKHFEEWLKKQPSVLISFSGEPAIYINTGAATMLGVLAVTLDRLADDVGRIEGADIRDSYTFRMAAMTLGCYANRPVKELGIGTIS